MREVNPEFKKSQFQIKYILLYLKQFIQNPIQKMTKLPTWSWQSLMTVQLTFAITSGFVTGLFKLLFIKLSAQTQLIQLQPPFLALILTMLLMLIMSTISTMLLTTFFYYYFQFFENRTEGYRKIFTLITLSSIPVYLFQIVSEYFSAMTLIGFAFTSLLLIVGLTENFRIDKKRAYQISGFLYLLVFITWLIK